MRQIGTGHQQGIAGGQNTGQASGQSFEHSAVLAAYHQGYQLERSCQGALQERQFNFKRMFFIVEDARQGNAFGCQGSLQRHYGFLIHGYIPERGGVRVCPLVRTGAGW